MSSPRGIPITHAGNTALSRRVSLQGAALRMCGWIANNYEPYVTNIL